MWQISAFVSISLSMTKLSGDSLFNYPVWASPSRCQLGGKWPTSIWERVRSEKDQFSITEMCCGSVWIITSFIVSCFFNQQFAVVPHRCRIVGLECRWASGCLGFWLDKATKTWKMKRFRALKTQERSSQTHKSWTTRIKKSSVR